MKITVETQIVIDAEPAEVFKYLANRKYHYLWNPQMHSISPTGALKLGSTYTTESLVLGMPIKSTNVITVFEPPEQLAMENGLGYVKYQAHFRLSPKGKKTFVKLTISLSADSRLRMFTAPVLKQLAQRELRTDLQALKVAVENHLE